MKRFPFPKDQEVGNTLYTQRNTQKQEHTGKKLEQQAFRAVEEHGGTLRILTYCAERLAER